MRKRIRIADLPRFDIADHLGDELAIAQYLAVVAEENEAAELARALEMVRGVRETAYLMAVPGMRASAKKLSRKQGW